jgi:cytochrome P450
MSQPWIADGFPPLAGSRFDFDLDEDSFAFMGEALAEGGDLVGVAPERGSRAAVLVNRPDEAWHVLGRNHANYRKALGARKVRMLLGSGLIAVEGRTWRNRRRILQPSFHQEAVSRFAEVMVEANRRLLDEWCRRASAGESIDVSTDTARLTLEIIVECLFGEELEEIASELGDIPFALLTDDLTRTLSTVHELRRERERLGKYIGRRRERDEQPPDLVGVLIAARDADTGEPLDDKAVMDEVVTLAVAGHETSASALTWAWYLLSTHADVESALHAEVDAIPESGPRRPRDLQDLPYTRRVLDETLRLYPPGWLLARRALDDDALGPYRIPAGTDVLVSPYYLHRNPELWPDPETFAPDRFLEEPRHKHAYLPFGAGPRRCIGDVFGMVEMQFHLAHAARRLRLRYLGEGPPAIEAKVNLRPKEQLIFRGELR